jgi:hypothetical protein
MKAVRAAVALAMVLGPAPGATAEIEPGASLCAQIDALADGQELVLQPGEYRGPCAIRRDGRPGAPLVIRAADPAAPPRIVYDGTGSNVLSIRASHVVIRGLRFGPTQPGVDAIRIYGGRDITIEDSEFEGLGGASVVASHASVRGLTVRRNVVRSSRATAMYFGCHDGRGCVISDLRVERNTIQGVTAPNLQVGYGIQVKLNSTGVIRANVVVNPKGPGIMVYGAQDGLSASVVERNVIMGSRESAGIVVGGGPAIVRNNIAALNAQGGISLQDYANRGLLSGIVVAHNTLYANGAAGIRVPETGLLQAIVLNNAVHALPGVQALPDAQPGLDLAGNADCGGLACFADPEGLDFSPLVGAPLLGLGAVHGEAWTAREDFFGRPRGPIPTVGAVERAGSGPVTLRPWR